MVENISGLGPIKPIDSKDLGKAGQTAGANKSFSKVLGDFMNKMNDMQIDADDKIQKLASGEITDIHQVITALTEADVSFRMMMSIRSKLVEAYKEVMKMQV